MLMSPQPRDLFKSNSTKSKRVEQSLLLSGRSQLLSNPDSRAQLFGNCTAKSVSGPTATRASPKRLSSGSRAGPPPYKQAPR